jgi:hypothetical protein
VPRGRDTTSPEVGSRDSPRARAHPVPNRDDHLLVGVTREQVVVAGNVPGQPTGVTRSSVNRTSTGAVALPDR